MTTPLRDNRYNQSLAGPLGNGYTPADAGPRVVRIDAPADLANIDAVWTPVASGSRDATSAQDRAVGLWMRLLPVGIIILATATAGTVAWMLVQWHYDIPPAPWSADRILLWLGILAILGVRAWDRESRRDWDHSHGGIERHRISTAAEVRIAESEAELELRRLALTATLKMLEERDAGR